MRVALYARVSTVNGQQDPEMQLRELRASARRRIATGEHALALDAAALARKARAAELGRGS